MDGPGWLAVSRGIDPADLDVAWRSLAAKGPSADRTVLTAGGALRQRLEDDTDRTTTPVWEQVGEERAIRFAEGFEPPRELLLRRVDETASPNDQPASRIHSRR